jgi:hypothetical protein
MDKRFELAGRLGTALAAILVVAGCTGAASSSPASAGPSAPTTSAATTMSPAPTAGPTASPALTPGASPAAPASSPAPSPTQAATPGPIPAKPPVATLRGLAGGGAAGQLGSYTWGSGGSDAPWIVGKVLGTAPSGASLDVSLGGAVPAGWTAAWAEVSGGVAGSPSGGTSGSGQVAVTAPATGDWSLRVTTTFGPGHNATYFWHLTIIK